MLAFRDKTPYSSLLVPGLDVDGHNYAVVVTKGTFSIDVPRQTLKLHEEQTPPCTTDEYYGDPDLSSVKYEADTALLKKTTDVIINSTAYAPRGRKVDQLLAGIRLDNLQASVAVTGNRYWEKHGAHWRMSTPEAFTSIPIQFENAFGGKGSKALGNENDYYRFNSVGKGFVPAKGGRPYDGMPLPNIENPKQLIQYWTDQPRPAGFGFIARQWEPRLSLAGTYDEQWQRTRMPLLPLNFDPLYFNAAHPDLRLQHFLKGGERVALTHLHPQGDCQFDLPKGNLLVKIYERGVKKLSAAHMDTVLIEPDDDKIQITWRSTFKCMKHIQYIDQIDVEWVN